MILNLLTASCFSSFKTTPHIHQSPTGTFSAVQSLTPEIFPRTSNDQNQSTEYELPAGCVVNPPQALYQAPDLNQEIIIELGPQSCGTIIGQYPATRWVLLDVRNTQGWISLEVLEVSGSLHQVEMIEDPQVEKKKTPQISSGGSISHPTPVPSAIRSNFPDSFQNLILQDYPFEYNCQEYQLQLEVAPKLDSYYSNQDKAYYYSGELPADWQTDYYIEFLSSSQDLAAINYTIQSIQDAVHPENSDQLLLALVRFVQHLNYDCDKYFSYQNFLEDDYATSYPYETLVDQSGVCGDFSLLLGKFFQQMDYGAALLVYNNLNHMAVGLQCPLESSNYQWNGVGYCFVETTIPSRIGVLPDSINKQPFNETPAFIPISDGKTFEMIEDLQISRQQEVEQFGSYILSLTGCDEIAAYKSVRNLELTIQTLEGELSVLNQRISNLDKKLDQKIANYRSSGCEGTLPEEKYDQCLTKYNNLKSDEKTYNQVVNTYNNTFQEYQNVVSGYEIELANLNSRIMEEAVDCSTVTLDKLPTPQP